MRVTCTAKAPQGLPDVMTLEAGAELGDMLVLAVDQPERYGIITCYQCDRAFAADQRAVIAHRANADEEDLDLWAFHDKCAERYRDQCRPIVVTVHDDGTAEVTGPTGTEVTVVADFLGQERTRR